MSTLSEAKLQEDLKEAMRARAADQVLVLRGLLAAVKNLKIERRGAAGGESVELAEADIAGIVRREIKQREEALGFAEQGGRSDLVAKNRAEKEMLERMLPQALSGEELEAAIRRHHEAGAANIGALMAKLKAEFGPRLDGKTASEAVRKFLAS